MIDTTMIVRNDPRPNLPPAAEFNNHFPAINTFYHIFVPGPVNPFREHDLFTLKGVLARNFVFPARPQACDRKKRDWYRSVEGGLYLSPFFEIRRESSTGREQSRRAKELPKMENKPNLNKLKFESNSLMTKGYAKSAPEYVKKTNPIQTQFKAKQTQFQKDKSKMLFPQKRRNYENDIGIRPFHPPTEMIIIYQEGSFVRDMVGFSIKTVLIDRVG